jgi:hypothetical protein
MANSCKAVAVVAGQPMEVATSAFNYGRHLVLHLLLFCYFQAHFHSS